ncbi:MAG: hypothetical protein O8C66_15995, partial [Candidatus Methanoperedens sp.]|nr:hypothetical protein [Candidatus Methanoperedens sp.]
VITQELRFGSFERRRSVTQIAGSFTRRLVVYCQAGYGEIHIFGSWRVLGSRDRARGSAD